MLRILNNLRHGAISQTKSLLNSALFLHELPKISIVSNRTKYNNDRHSDPEYLLERSRKVWKVELPDFDKLRREQKDMTQDQIKSELKEKGIISPTPWNEREVYASCTISVINTYKPQIGQHYIQARGFHAAGSKIKYMDFRYRLKTTHLRLHLLIIRRQKMKKHKRRKFRKKFKTLLAKQRLKRNIAKEKAFRVELLTMIRNAENFDPREYALRKIAEVTDKPKVLTREEKLEELKELIRKNRYQVSYIKPRHRRAV